MRALSPEQSAAVGAGLERYVEAIRRHWPLPGCAIAVSDREGTLLTVLAGDADRATRDPVTAETRFEIGSLSKAITALVVLQLVDEGAIALDDPVARHLPWFRVRSSFPPITVAQLLHHTGGLISGSDAVPDDLAQVWALRETAVGSPPGTFFHYSNVGYQALGALIERVCGRSLPDVVRDRVLAPLAMERSTADIRHGDHATLAVGYEPHHDDRPYLPGDELRPATWLETSTADGNVAGPLEDLSRYVRALLREGELDGRRVASAAGFRALIGRAAPEGEPPWPGSRYAFGLNVATVDGHRYLDHGGGMVGFCSHLVTDQDAGLGVIVLSNASGSSPVAVILASHAMALLRAAVAGRPLPAPPNPDPAVLDGGRLAGRYRDGALEIVVHPTADGGAELEADGATGVLLRTGGDRLACTHPQLRRFHHWPPTDDAPDAWACGPHLLRRVAGAPDPVAPSPTAAASASQPGDPAQSPSLPVEWRPFLGRYRAYTPWFPTFRIVDRAGRLHLVSDVGVEAATDDPPLVPLPDGRFRVGDDPRLPERIRFGPIADDRCLSAELDGCVYSRSRDPSD